MSPEDSKALVRRMLEGWWIKGDVGVLDETHSPDFVAHTANGDTRGRDAQKQRLTAFITMFASRRLTIDDLFGEVDRVAVRYTWEATHEGEAFGLAPTNNRVRSSTIAMYRIAGGMIVEEWEEHDTQGLMQQLRARA